MPRVKVIVKGTIPKYTETPKVQPKLTLQDHEKTMPRHVRIWLNDRRENQREIIKKLLRTGKIKHPLESGYPLPEYRHTVLNFHKKGGAKKVIGPLRQGTLRNHGYSTKLSAAKRQTALRKAVKEYSALVVFRKLNAVAVLQKNKNPSVSKIFKSDSMWVRTTFAKQFKY
jgi:hypothetical protein